MTQKNEIYKCVGCGNVIEVLHAGTCIPQCCGKPMQLMQENTVDAAKEKHVPIITKIDGGYKIAFTILYIISGLRRSAEPSPFLTTFG